MLVIYINGFCPALDVNDEVYFLYLYICFCANRSILNFLLWQVTRLPYWF